MKFSKNVNNNKDSPKLIFFNQKKIEKDSDNFWHRKLTLKVRNQDFSIATCQTYVDLPKNFFYGKVLFFTQLSCHLMRKLLKKSWMVSNMYAYAYVRQHINKRKTRPTSVSKEIIMTLLLLIGRVTCRFLLTWLKRVSICLSKHAHVCCVLGLANCNICTVWICNLCSVWMKNKVLTQLSSCCFLQLLKASEWIMWQVDLPKRNEIYG